MKNWRIFFTSDWHLGHENAIKYDKRPFKDCAEMAETLVRRFNATVPEDGTTYFLGDMGNKTEDISKVIKRLNGTKILILGNHDKNVGTMLNCGFDAVLYNATIFIHGQRVTMSHCPLLDTFREDTSIMTAYKDKGLDKFPVWHGNDRPKHRVLSVENNGQFHIHGHIHSQKDRPQSKTEEGRQFDVGVCAHKYLPVSIRQIESFIMRTLINEQ